jgi:beta-ribofuranosylaminobenzene 5'-phosphate synthase
MPCWRVLLVMPSRGKCVYGDLEAELFKRYTPVGLNEVYETAYYVHNVIIPALIEKDIEAFGKAIAAIRRIGFKRNEILYQDGTVRSVIERLEDLGIHGVSMSSWGPAVVGFTNVVSKHIDSELQNMHKGGQIKWWKWTRPRNHGAVVKHKPLK